MDWLWESEPLLLTLVYLFLSVSGALVSRYVWRKVLPILTARTRTTLDEMIARDTASPVSLSVLLFGLWRTALAANNYGLLHDSWMSNVQMGLEIATIYAVAFLLNGVIKGVLDWYGEEIAPKTDTQLDDDFLPLIRRLSFILLLFLATAMALQEMGKDVTALIATASVASLAVALAAQDTLSNMISGIMIMLDRPFRIGDRIEFGDGKVGDVLEIGMRSTRILSVDNHVLVVPNKELANERIVNHKLLDPKVRLVQGVGVAYSSDTAQVKSLMLSIAQATPHVLKEPAPQVLLLDFQDSALYFELRCWVEHYRDYWMTKDALNTAIKEAFDRHGISIPFPQREVRVIGLPAEQQVPQAVREAAAGKE